MAFSLGLLSVGKKDIRHIYSTNISVENRSRKERDYTYKHINRNMEYTGYFHSPFPASEDSKECNLIPKAPAFRVMSSHKVKEITNRLHKPTFGIHRSKTIPVMVTEEQTLVKNDNRHEKHNQQDKIVSG